MARAAARVEGMVVTTVAVKEEVAMEEEAAMEAGAMAVG